MSLGIIEVITLLLGMAGFGLAPNPKPATPDQALRYALPDPDIVAHIDATSLIPGNYKLLGQLADQPQIKASPELQKLVREAIGEIEGARGIARFATGIDVTADIADATAFVQLVAQADPSFVIAVRGKFAPGNLEKIGYLTERAEAAEAKAKPVIVEPERAPAARPPAGKPATPPVAAPPTAKPPAARPPTRP